MEQVKDQDGYVSELLRVRHLFRCYELAYFLEQFCNGAIGGAVWNQVIRPGCNFLLQNRDIASMLQTLGHG